MCNHLRILPNLYRSLKNSNHLGRLISSRDFTSRHFIAKPGFSGDIFLKHRRDSNVTHFFSGKAVFFFGLLFYTRKTACIPNDLRKVNFFREWREKRVTFLHLRIKNTGGVACLFFHRLCTNETPFTISDSFGNNDRLMEKILHQLICSLAHYLQGFTHPRWFSRISELSAVVLVTMIRDSDHVQRPQERWKAVSHGLRGKSSWTCWESVGVYLGDIWILDP